MTKRKAIEIENSQIRPYVHFLKRGKPQRHELRVTNNTTATSAVLKAKATVTEANLKVVALGSTMSRWTWTKQRTKIYVTRQCESLITINACFPPLSERAKRSSLRALLTRYWRMVCTWSGNSIRSTVRTRNRRSMMALGTESTQLVSAKVR